MNKAAKAYFQTRVSTTDQGQLLLMLYDGALNFLQQAREKMLAKDYAAKGILISKVIDIINELSSSLNMEKGGSLATNLNNLYFLCTARLLQANLKMSVESLDSVVQILSGLRSAYAQIIETPEARQASAEIAGRMQPRASHPTHQPVMTGGPATAVPRAQAQAAYGRTARQSGLSVLPPVMPPQTAAAGQQPPASAAAQGRPSQPQQISQQAAAQAQQPAQSDPDAARANVQNFVPPLTPRMPNPYAKLNKQ